MSRPDPSSAPQPPAGPTYEQAVSSWAAHLRAGGTTSWRAYTPPTGYAESRVPQPLPDGVHLELARRINTAASGRADPGLVDLVLSTGIPGRGPVDVPLPWSGGGRRFGSPAVDPSQLPAPALVRLAVGVLARLLPGLPVPPASDVPRRRPAPWRRRFQLHGSPETVAATRTALLGRGLVETDWRATHVVIARPVEVMMAEHWATSALDGGILRWESLWRRARALDRLPSRIDVAAIAARLATGRGAVRVRDVHVVLARDRSEAIALTAGLLGAAPVSASECHDLSLSDLLRRLNRVTPLTSGPEQVRPSAASVVRLLAAAPASRESLPPLAPRQVLPWAREAAARTQTALSNADYGVHGDPTVLAPAAHRRSHPIDHDHTLELALTALEQAWHQQEGHT